MTIHEFNRLVPHSMGYDELRGTYRCSRCTREIYLLDTGIEEVAPGQQVVVNGCVTAYPHRGSRGGLLIAPRVEHGPL